MTKALLVVMLACVLPANAQPEAPLPKPAPAAPVLAEPEAQAKLMVGDKAPPLSIERWIRGEEVKSFEKGHIYVLEFWATWCGPCVAAMPHLSALQTKHKDDRVQIIGINVLDDRADVDAFMDKGKGAKVQFSMAVDKVRDPNDPNKHGGMLIDWLKAAKLVGLPQTIVVNRDGLIAWIGGPTDLEEPLAKIVAGTWDLAAHSAKYKRLAANDARANEVEVLIWRARDAKDCDKVDALLTEIQGLTDRTAEDLSYYRFTTMVKCGAMKKAYDAARMALKSKYAKHSDKMNDIAWTIVDPASKIAERDYDIALAAARIAFELTDGKDYEILDTLALCEFKKGNIARAIELQTTAVELSTPESKAELEGRLAQFKAAKN